MKKYLIVALLITACKSQESEDAAIADVLAAIRKGYTTGYYQDSTFTKTWIITLNRLNLNNPASKHNLDICHLRDSLIALKF